MPKHCHCHRKCHQMTYMFGPIVIPQKTIIPLKPIVGQPALIDLVITPDSGLPTNTLSLRHDFGYTFCPNGRALLDRCGRALLDRCGDTVEQSVPNGPDSLSVMLNIDGGALFPATVLSATCDLITIRLNLSVPPSTRVGIFVYQGTTLVSAGSYRVTF